ncbi:MAG TPA: hypothetical protein VKN16_21540 [Methylomirabilota bacterium]|jgi:hypothetical protein|nr:hypothetical protein [Methylomirabilota bacterium]
MMTVSDSRRDALARVVRINTENLEIAGEALLDALLVWHEADSRALRDAENDACAELAKFYCLYPLPLLMGRPRNEATYAQGWLDAAQKIEREIRARRAGKP